MSTLVKLTLSRRLADDARNHRETGGGHDHMTMAVEGSTWRERLVKSETRVRVAQNFVMEWGMLWKDLAAGFLIGGLLTMFVPNAVWQALFFVHAPTWIRMPLNALIGPLVAVLTFVCSIGNVPLAAVLWSGGASFGGVIAFLFADLIVLPLLDVYRRYFGWKMAAYMAVIFYVTMAASALIVDLAFTWAGIVPPRTANIQGRMTHFSVNYTFWLNLVALTLATYLYLQNRRHPMNHVHRHGGC